MAKNKDAAPEWATKSWDLEGGRDFSFVPLVYYEESEAQSRNRTCSRPNCLLLGEPREKPRSCGFLVRFLLHP